MSFDQAFQELADYSERAQDFVADTREISMGLTVVGEEPRISGIGDTGMMMSRMFEDRFIGINSNGHRQIAQRMGIDWKYYQRCLKDAPWLLTKNVNWWLDHEPKKLMFRAMDRNLRALLSSKYRRIDNVNVMSAALPHLEKSDYKLTSAQISPDSMVIRAIVGDPKELKQIGDIAQRGIRIRNSEVGYGAFVVEPFVRILSCLNGMTMEDSRIRRQHIGTELDAGLLSSTTVAADDSVFLMKAGDMIDAFADESQFDSFWYAIETAGSSKLDSPVAACQVLGKTANLSKDETYGVTNEFMRAADPTVWGLVQALTAFAHKGDMGEDENMDRRAELESAAGSIVMNQQTCAALAQAA